MLMLAKPECVNDQLHCDMLKLDEIIQLSVIEKRQVSRINTWVIRYITMHINLLTLIHSVYLVLMMQFAFYIHRIYSAFASLIIFVIGIRPYSPTFFLPEIIVWFLHLLHILKFTSDWVLSWKQTLWTLIGLLPWEQSDLGSYCLQYRLPKTISRWGKQKTNAVTSGWSVNMIFHEI